MQPGKPFENILDSSASSASSQPADLTAHAIGTFSMKQLMVHCSSEDHEPPKTTESSGTNIRIVKN